MKPLHFGPPDRPLFGVHHQPTSARDQGWAVLVCNPFGEEAVMGHRTLRVLAGRLAQAGAHVLRFDYHGTGDSSGDCAEADLQRWTEDVLTASLELVRRSGARAVSWVGQRLGATLALAAAARVEPALEHLVLWDPIVDGRGYLAELAATHDRFMQANVGEAWRGLPPAAADGVPLGDEVLGYALPARLRAQLLALDAASPQPVRARRLTVLAPGTPALARLRERLVNAVPQARFVAAPDEAGRNTTQLVSTELPAASIAALVETLAPEPPP